ncbi:aspartate kinase [Marivirga salinae]|uniref:Aspartokinase n=1 Tax=Marivirga salinarum TaxID=3059078 RepID=A0AA51NCG2_9BACT|nr:aspartate kinase [Marivirga sp. BDSF4-3]WMN12578.1 aspartate kinase [Marivirga sp. BDSF4-3]
MEYLFVLMLNYEKIAAYFAIHYKKEQMQVFKFGGASIKDAEAVRNMSDILKRFPDEKIIIVVSAMGKTTNALEEILHLKLDELSIETAIQNLFQYHSVIISKLFEKNEANILQLLERMFEDLKIKLSGVNKSRYDESYDSIISFGEMISSSILLEFLKKEDFSISKIDAKNCISTDESFRDALVDWEQTKKSIQKIIHHEFSQNQLVITQGFLGGTSNGKITTLGREGSDFTAAIFAYCTNAQAVTIWKDVPGILNGDPKKIKDAVLYQELSYQEAAEMTYYGASVIHPKTIKPLAIAGIPMHVRSFSSPEKGGTIIHNCKIVHEIPCIIIKEKQSLITFKLTDFTFITEALFGKIFEALNKHHIKINMMQNTAISFSVCVNDDLHRLDQLINELKDDFSILYNKGLELITIKNCNDSLIERMRAGKEIYMEQRTRKNYQVVKGV